MSPDADKPAILVAGGADYIGSHTAKMLRQSGFLPVVLDHLTTGNRWAVRFGPFVEGSVADPIWWKRPRGSSG
jgi:UDP-arabinose 4-epimerase